MRGERSSFGGWQLTTLIRGRAVVLCEHDGRWSVVVPGVAADDRSLDVALVRALRGLHSG